jgi:peptide deformylase
MAIRTILHYPNPRLREKAEPVAEVTPAIQQLVEDMVETMYATPGAIGLAATQIGELHRIFVIDTASHDAPSNLLVFINPEVLSSEGEIELEEGCLSFPTVLEHIERKAKVSGRALDRAGEPFEFEADGLSAVAVQHELDHLDGVLIIDHVGALKKRIIDRQMRKGKV